jgi:starch phosphorylase
MVSATDLDGRIAYYTMEIGIENDVKTYSGGLGVLAGDTIRSFADMGLPAVCVSQVNENGYCKQILEEDGSQISEEDPWPVEEYCEKLDVEVTVPIYGRDVTVTAWKYDVVSEKSGHTVPIIYLDSNVESNDPDAQEYTKRLYSPGYGEDHQLAQEIILGIGGTRILDELGYEVDVYHMNEGHAALLTLELLKRNDMDPEAVREQCVFTTHTPVARQRSPRGVRPPGDAQRVQPRAGPAHDVPGAESLAVRQLRGEETPGGLPEHVPGLRYRRDHQRCPRPLLGR